MWGEIPSKTDSDQLDQSGDATTDLPSKPILAKLDQRDTLSNHATTSATAEDMLDRIAVSDAFFKSQQRDDPDLSFEEKRKIAEEILNNNPSLFLTRYGKFLIESDLKYFEKSTASYEVEYYLAALRKRFDGKLQSNIIKNRRCQAAQRMVKSGDDYFSESQMKARNPLLYESLIGKYMTEEEKYANDREARSNCSLSKIILDHMDLNRERDLKKLQEEEENFEEFDEDNIVHSSPDIDQAEISDDEKDKLKDDFLKIMLQDFIDGKDSRYDYKLIDDNEEFDDLEIINRDAEDKYFDE